MSEPRLFNQTDYPVSDKYSVGESMKKKRDDTDLIIEDNTVYEIDRECYERLRKQRKRKSQEKKLV